MQQSLAECIGNGEVRCLVFKTSVLLDPARDTKQVGCRVIGLQIVCSI